MADQAQRDIRQKANFIPAWGYHIDGSRQVTPLSEEEHSYGDEPLPRCRG